MNWDEEFDFVVAGSGGGSMCAALAAQARGLRPLIVEKQPTIGGSTAYSGGVLWIPNNPLMRRAGVHDSPERALQYFESAVKYHGPGTSPARREAYVRTGPDMVTFLESLGLPLVYTDGWPDYYDEVPGGEPRGRSLITRMFDLNELGEWKTRINRRPGRGLPVMGGEGIYLTLMKRTFAGRLAMVRLAWRMALNKWAGKSLAGMGAALQGRMLQIALKKGIPIWPSAPLKDFVVEGGRVVGVVVERDGKTLRIRARDGVLLNSGGFSHNADMRSRYQPKPASSNWTASNPGDTGEVIEMAMRLGAATDCLDESWWIMTSMGPNQTPPPGTVTADGKFVPHTHHVDISMPYSFLVDQDGRRFADEASSYMDIGQRMYQRQRETGKAVPAWFVMERRFREFYPWGGSLPGVTPQAWLDSGYMKTGDTLEELARLCGIDPAGLKATTERYKSFCERGVDEDYRRGGRAFDLSHGDPNVKPNPSLGPVEQGPFCAVAMYPGDVGTAGGIVADEFARVVRTDGAVIPGLYATGNCTASVMGRTYPGAGASIGASFVFGYIAARHASSAPVSLAQGAAPAGTPSTQPVMEKA